MKSFKFLLLIFFLFYFSVYAQNGLITKKSVNNFETTINLLEQTLVEHGLKIFTKINHSEGAKKAGLELNPTTLIIFGNPKIGTKLMQCEQTIAIELPQKILIWQDEHGNVWLSYNDPDYLSEKYQLNDCKEVIKKIKGALNKFVTTASETQN